jgi:hypothetical protein
VRHVPTRGYAKPITRKQARSYNRTTPNGMGVTAIAALSNARRKKKSSAKRRMPASFIPIPKGSKPLRAGKGAVCFVKPKARKSIAKKLGVKPNARRRSPEYARRYQQSRALLTTNKRRTMRRNQARTLVGMSPRARSGETLVGMPIISVGAAKTRRRKAATKKKARRVAAKRPAKRTRKTTAARKPRRSAAQKAATKKMLAAAKRARGGKRRAAPKRRKTSRKVGRSYGKFRSAVARVGGLRLPTYVRRTKKGRLSHIPLHAIVGTSAKKLHDYTTGGKGSDTPAAARIRKRVAAVQRARNRAAARVGRAGSIFVPNVSPFGFEENSDMDANKKRKSRKGRKSTKRASAARKAAKTRALKHAARSAAARKAARTRKRRRSGAKAAAPKRRRSSARRRKTGRRRQTAAQRRASLRNLKKARSARRGGHRRKARRNGPAALLQAAANRRRRSRHAAAPNRRRRHHRRYDQNVMTFFENRRRRHGRRRAHRNPFSSAAFMAQLKSSLKVGAIVLGGFIAHRALSKVVNDQAISKVDAIPAAWKGVASGAIVAAIGLPIAAKVSPKHVASIGAGIMTSFLHTLLTTVLKSAGQDQIVGYLGAYVDAPGKPYHGYGYGDYGQFGEYLQTSGFGDDEYSGYGVDLTGYGVDLTGYGAAPMITQAAAGYGALPAITQAAAGYDGFGEDLEGTGEFVVTDARGIGDYEEVSGYDGMSAYGAVDDGIRPDLASAERALNIAEAAAGIGDLPLTTRGAMNPVMVAAPVPVGPSGMRAGILKGGDGIFG